VDADLVIRAQRGDQRAFTAIATDTYGRLHRVAFGILRDHELAQDAVQRAMIDAWRNLPGLRDPDRFDAWAYRLVVNACHAEGGRARRWQPAIRLAGDGDESWTEADGSSPDALRMVEDRDQLERGFRRLSVEHRAVLVLHHLLDLPVEHIAAVLGVPTGTVRSRLHRALEALRAALSAEERTPVRTAMTREVTR
jgi:RNA polymerase sigma-70 factor (ECF subfamily)